MDYSKEHCEEVAKKLIEEKEVCYAYTKKRDTGRYYVVAEYNHFSSAVGIMQHCTELVKLNECDIIPAFENTEGKI